LYKLKHLVVTKCGTRLLTFVKLNIKTPNIKCSDLRTQTTVLRSNADKCLKLICVTLSATLRPTELNFITTVSPNLLKSFGSKISQVFIKHDLLYGLHCRKFH